MDEFYSTPEIERYLQSVIGTSVRLVKQSILAKPGKKELKGYGYGTPVLLKYETDGRRGRAVLHTVRPGPFGHEHMSDRAQSLLWDHSAFNTLPRMMPAMLRRMGILVSRSFPTAVAVAPRVTKLIVKPRMNITELIITARFREESRAFPFS